MTDILTFTVPDHLQRAVSDLIRDLQGLTESQLEELSAQQHAQLAFRDSRLIGGRVVWDDPVNGVWSAVHDLRVAEHNYRLEIVQRMEAELNGGHLVGVWIGNDVSKYAAVCDPNRPEPFCWEGPDRDTVEEAAADGRAHHPGHEPRVSDSVNWTDTV